MSRHPVTPMHEADLRRHLALQGLPDIAAIHHPAYATGLEAALDELPPASTVLLDVMNEANLAAIGEAIWRHAAKLPLLAVGSSSVAQAMVKAWNLGTPTQDACSLPPADGPVLILAGSLSPVTRRQVAAATEFHHVAIDAERLTHDTAYLAQAAAHMADQLRSGRHVLAYTAAAGMPMEPTHATAVAEATAKLLATVLDQIPLRRVGIAGGDTSSQAVQALDLWGLSHVATFAPGVAVCRTHSANLRRHGIELMLKGGQMGHSDLFDGFIGGELAV